MAFKNRLLLSHTILLACLLVTYCVFAKTKSMDEDDVVGCGDPSRFILQQYQDSTCNVKADK